MKKAQATIILVIIAMIIVLSVGGILIYFNLNKTPDNQTPIVGGDRDSHGCIPSAGYTWCEAKQKCIRSWEEGDWRWRYARVHTQFRSYGEIYFRLNRGWRNA